MKSNEHPQDESIKIKQSCLHHPSLKTQQPHTHLTKNQSVNNSFKKQNVDFIFYQRCIGRCGEYQCVLVSNRNKSRGTNDNAENPTSESDDNGDKDTNNRAVHHAMPHVSNALTRSQDNNDNNTITHRDINNSAKSNSSNCNMNLSSTTTTTNNDNDDE